MTTTTATTPANGTGTAIERANRNRAVERADEASLTVVGWLRTLAPELQRAMPSGMNADRLTRVVLTEVRRNPDLQLTTPESFAGALLTTAALGLEPGTPTGEAYLVPYEHHRGPLAGKIECQLIIGYQGLTKLFYQHPLARHVDAQAVYEADDFDWELGTNPYLRHKPARGERGDVVDYYAVASLSTGASRFVVLSPEEVKALRGGKVGPKGNIADPQRWMERKTPLRQLLKLMPKAAALTRSLEVDEKVVTGRTVEEIEANAPRALDASAEPVSADPVTGEITGEPTADDIANAFPEDRT